MERSYKDDLNDTCLSSIACCSAEIIADRLSKKYIHPYGCYSRGAFIRIHTCTYLAAVIFALEQAMKLKLAPFY